ncbi:copia protein [Tanacetum coccineum]
MERGFLSQKWSRVRRGVKEKNVNASNLEVVKDCVVPSITVAYGNTQKDLNDDPMAMEVQNPLVDQTNGSAKSVGGSYPPLPTQGTTPAGNTPGKIDVVVSVESIRAISERFVNTSYGFFLGKRVAYPVVANYVRNTWGKFGLVKSMLNSSTGLFSFQFSYMDGLNSILENGPWFIRNHPLILQKWNPDVDLLKEDVGNVLVWVKLHGVTVTEFSEDGLSAISIKLGNPLMLDSYTFNMCLQSWGMSSYARVMIELRADVELKDNIIVAMPKITREGLGVAKNLKKPSQTSRGVSVGPKVGFKPHKEYRPVPKKPTASPSGNKKKCVAHTNEVSNSNPFDVLNSVDNDVEFGTNGGTTNLVKNEANSSGPSFMNVENSSTSNTPIIDKIRKFEDLLIDGKAILVDEAGNPLKKVECLGDYDSEDEVASVDNDMARSLASEKDLPQEIQAICDNIDIRVRGRKKK